MSHITYNHHGEATFISWPMQLSKCLFVTIPAVVTYFSRNSNFSPTLPPSPLTIPVIAQKPPVRWSSSDNSRLSCRADYPPKQLAPGSGLSGLERMTSFPLFPSFRLSSAHEQSTVSPGEINRSCVYSSITKERHTQGYMVRTLQSGHQEWKSCGKGAKFRGKIEGENCQQR